MRTFIISPPDLDGGVRAHYSAEGAAGAFFFICELSGMDSLAIEIGREDDDFSRAELNAKTTAFASLLVNHNLRHSSFASFPRRALKEL
jgi:hypothetical protein